MAGTKNNIAAGPLPAWAISLGGVIAVFCVYALAHGLLRMVASPNLSQDDVMAVLYSQTLELGYSPRQPPLYDWTLWLVQQITGPRLVSFLLIKYVLLTATGTFIYLAGLRMYGERTWAALAAFSLLLLYQVGWNIHEGVTHTATMMLAIAATFWAFMRVVEVGTWRDHLVLGLTLGLGGLTKYGFAVFAVILIVASLLQPAMRVKILTRRMAVTALVAALIIAPFALWVVFNDHDLGALFNATLSGGDTSHMQKASRGVFLAFRSTLTFLSPLILIIPLVFWGSLGAMRKAVSAAFVTTSAPDWEKLLLHMAFAALIIMVLAALVTGVSTYRMRYMHPFYLLMPLWLVGMAARGVNRAWQPKAFVAVSLMFAFIVLGLRAGYLYVGEKPFCTKCRQMIPYDILADSLARNGFKSGTIIAGYRHTAGNLRRIFPDARVVALRRPAVAPPIRPGDRVGQIAIVWDTASEGPDIPKGAADHVAALGGRISDSPPVTISAPWSHLWRPLGYRSSRWKFIVVDLGPQ